MRIAILIIISALSINFLLDTLMDQSQNETISDLKARIETLEK